MQDSLSAFRADLFAGRRFVVSGGTSGIGLALAKGFARLGAETIATGTSEKRLSSAHADAEASTVNFQRLDVRDRAGVTTFFAALPGLDVLVNAAGVARPEREFEEADFLDVMDVNLNSVMRLSMAARPLLERAKGSILNVASMLSFLADDSVPAYCASKTGVVGLTRALAHRFGPAGVRVNAIAPGYHTTDMTKALSSGPDAASRIAGKAALKRWGTVDDLVGAAVFLSSPAAAFVTGATLPVDGGYVVSGL